MKSILACLGVILGITLPAILFLSVLLLRIRLLLKVRIDIREISRNVAVFSGLIFPVAGTFAYNFLSIDYRGKDKDLNAVVDALGVGVLVLMGTIIASFICGLLLFLATFLSSKNKQAFGSNQTVNNAINNTTFSSRKGNFDFGNINDRIALRQAIIQQLSPNSN